MSIYQLHVIIYCINTIFDTSQWFYYALFSWNFVSRQKLFLVTSLTQWLFKDVLISMFFNIFQFYLSSSFNSFWLEKSISCILNSLGHLFQFNRWPILKNVLYIRIMVLFCGVFSAGLLRPLQSGLQPWLSCWPSVFMHCLLKWIGRSYPQHLGLCHLLYLVLLVFKDGLKT